MTKTLAGVAIIGWAATSLSANAAQLTPYAVIRAGGARMVNQTHAKLDVSVGGNTVMRGDLSDDRHTDDVMGINLAIGGAYSVAHDARIRAEVEFAHIGTGRDENDFSIMISDLYRYQYRTETWIVTGGVNVYYDFARTGILRPYIGGGIGCAYGRVKSRVDAVDMGVTSGDVNPTWNIGAGFAIKVYDGFNLDLGYRYSDWGTTDSKSIIEIDGVRMTMHGEFKLSAHQFLIGIRHEF